MPYPAASLYPQVSGLYPGDGVEVIPTVTTGASSSIATTTATVAGTVNPNSLTTHYYVEYSLIPRLYPSGTSPVFYGSQSPEGNAGAGSSPVAVTRNLSNLATGRTYYYTFVAFNGAGFGYGSEGTFNTLVDDLAEDLSAFVHTADRGQ